jgi:hypothetical protein
MDELTLETLTSLVTQFEAATEDEQKEILKNLTNRILNMMEVPEDIRQKLFDVISYFSSVLAAEDDE